MRRARLTLPAHAPTGRITLPSVAPHAECATVRRGTDGLCARLPHRAHVISQRMHPASANGPIIQDDSDSFIRRSGRWIGRSRESEDRAYRTVALFAARANTGLSTWTKSPCLPTLSNPVGCSRFPAFPQTCANSASSNVPLKMPTEHGVVVDQRPTGLLWSSHQRASK